MASCRALSTYGRLCGPFRTLRHCQEPPTHIQPAFMQFCASIARLSIQFWARNWIKWDTLSLGLCLGRFASAGLSETFNNIQSALSTKSVHKWRA